MNNDLKSKKILEKFCHECGKTINAKAEICPECGVRQTNQTISSTKGTGIIAGIISCILATLGILFFGTFFILIAVIIAFIGTIKAIKNMNIAGIGVNILAWLLIIFGLVTSPMLLTIVGLSMISG